MIFPPNPKPLNPKPEGTKSNGTYWIYDDRPWEAIYWPFHIRIYSGNLELQRQDCSLIFTVEIPEDSKWPYACWNLLSWDYANRKPVALEPEIGGPLWKLLNPFLLARILWKFFTR